MTAVTIQSNKIVSSEVKDNLALLEPSYGKTERKNLLANPIYTFLLETHPGSFDSYDDSRLHAQSLRCNTD